VRHRGALCAVPIVAALVGPLSSWAREVAPAITIAEGGGTVYAAAGGGYRPAAGVRLSTCDIVRTGPQGLVQVEYPDGGKIALGPDSRMVFDVPRGGEAAVGPHFLISGWVKVTVPKRDKALSYRIDTPQFDLITDAGAVTLRAGGDEGEFFVEQGGAAALVPAPAQGRVAVGSGRSFLRKAGDRGAVSNGVRHPFVEAMPRAFRDTLPNLLGQMKAANVQPRPSPEYRPGDAEEWLKSEPELRSCLSDVTVRSAQLALQRGGIEVGPIDGILGPRTAAALREFQQRNSLTRSGKLDAETLKALDLAR
jgi:hypothetical protein